MNTYNGMNGNNGEGAKTNMATAVNKFPIIIKSLTHPCEKRTLSVIHVSYRMSNIFLLIKQAKAASLPHFEYTLPTTTAMPSFDFYDFISELNITHGILYSFQYIDIYFYTSYRILIQNCFKRKRKSAQLMLEITTGGKCLTLKIQELLLLLPSKI